MPPRVCRALCKKVARQQGALSAAASKHGELILAAPQGSTPAQPQPPEMADAGPLVMAIGRIASDAEVSLEMRDIKIGAGGAAALANALKGNRKLTAADLYNAGIGEGGVEALAAAMADPEERNRVLMSRRRCAALWQAASAL